MSKQTFQSRKKRKIQKINPDCRLTLNYEEIDKNDIYGYYIMNRMEPSEAFKIPMIGDFHNTYPDYIALFNHPKEFEIRENASIGFYIKDILFDDIDGIYEAIIYKDTSLLLYYKSYFKNVKYFIAPDYSMYGNFKDSTLIHQLEKETVVIGWLVFELGAIVYPNITYGLQYTFEWCFKIIYKGSNVALSLKGCSTGINKKLLSEAIKRVVDEIQPQAIIVYSVASDKTTREILKYAFDNKIKIYIVANTLKMRNLRRLAANG